MGGVDVRAAPTTPPPFGRHSHSVLAPASRLGYALARPDAVPLRQRTVSSETARSFKIMRTHDPQGENEVRSQPDFARH
jgi:hypothetical protein